MNGFEETGKLDRFLKKKSNHKMDNKFEKTIEIPFQRECFFNFFFLFLLSDLMSIVIELSDRKSVV